jgi:hypothetical protein
LDKSLVQTGFAQDGQSGPDVTAGQVRSQTSTNNYINFCASVKVPLADGTQQKGGFCNPVPMGVLGKNTSYPATKFVNPKNFGSCSCLALSDIIKGFCF